MKQGGSDCPSQGLATCADSCMPIGKTCCASAAGYCPADEQCCTLADGQGGCCPLATSSEDSGQVFTSAAPASATGGDGNTGGQQVTSTTGGGANAVNNGGETGVSTSFGSPNSGCETRISYLTCSATLVVMVGSFSSAVLSLL